MGNTYRFLSAPSDAMVVCEWFRDLDAECVEQATVKGTLFYFKRFGPLSESPAESPIVNVIYPRIRRGILTTVGEVHFLATPLKRFPELAQIDKLFRKWISCYPKMHSVRDTHDNTYDYFIEGSLLNWDSEIFGFPSGIEALKAGRYFVSDDDSEARLDTLCRQLRLRGVEGIEEVEQATDGDAKEAV